VAAGALGAKRKKLAIWRPQHRRDESTSEEMAGDDVVSALQTATNE
jgi:hypothetical protein